MRSRSTTIGLIIGVAVAVALLLFVAIAFDSPVSTGLLAFVAIGSAFVAIQMSQRRGRG